MIFPFYAGVYLGITGFNDLEEQEKMESDANYIGASYLSMAANRTSYIFDFRGPSYTCDTACSSSLYAFINALNDLNSGRIDYAVVGGCQLTFHPYYLAALEKLNMTSPKGMLRAFSAERDGYVKSEAIIAILLQRENNCKRAYAIVAGGGTNSDGYKKEGISFPSYEGQLNLMSDIYTHFELNPDDVTYFEAHGTGKKFI